MSFCSALRLKIQGEADCKYIYQYTIKKYPLKGDFLIRVKNTPLRVKEGHLQQLKFEDGCIIVYNRSVSLK